MTVGLLRSEVKGRHPGWISLRPEEVAAFEQDGNMSCRCRLCEKRNITFGELPMKGHYVRCPARRAS
jgi:hypothetical protein